MESLAKVIEKRFWTCCTTDWNYELDACDGTLVRQVRPPAHEDSVPSDLPVSFLLSFCSDDSASPVTQSDFHQPLYLGVHSDDCHRAPRYEGEPIIHRSDLEALSFPVAFHLAADEDCALNGVNEPCCEGEKVIFRADRIIRGPEPPPPAWFLRDNSEIYETDIRRHIEGKVVNWRRLDSYLQDNWRPWKISAGKKGSPGGSVSWSAADYYRHFAEAARAASVGAA